MIIPSISILATFRTCTNDYLKEISLKIHLIVNFNNNSKVSSNIITTFIHSTEIQNNTINKISESLKHFPEKNI